MKPKSLAVTLLGCAVLGAAALVPQKTSGQAGGQEGIQLDQALADVAAQQVLIADNQVKIDEKVALVAEEVRIARIYAGRAGGKTK